MKKLCFLILPVLLLVLAGPVLAAESGFSDVPAGAWYAGEAAYCRERGWLGGTGGGMFSPDRSVTRGMAVTALYRLSGSPAASAAQRFSDVAAKDWYGPAVAWAAETGVTDGFEDGTFRPNEPVLRDQLAVFLWRMYGKPSGGEAAFSDKESIPAWASQAAGWAGEKELITGTSGGRFAPNQPTSRAQFAAILARCGRDWRFASVLDRACGASGIAEMEDGSLLLTDTFNKAVWQVKNGVTTRVAGAELPEDIYGEPTGGNLDAAPLTCTFREPWAITPFMKGWAISDSANAAVRLMQSDVVRTANCRFEGSVKGFQRPTGLATDEEGNLYVADSLQGVVFRVNAKGTASALITGLTEPAGLFWKDGTLYIAEAGANRVVKWTESAGLQTVAGTGEDGDAGGPADKAMFSFPQGVTVGEDGTIYVADTGNSAVRRIRNGTVETVASRDRGSEGPGLFSPAGLLVRGSTLYVCDSFTKKLLAIPLI